VVSKAPLPSASWLMAGGVEKVKENMLINWMKWG